MSRRRLPSPWVAVPIVLGTVAGGIIGYLVTEVSCAPASCVAAAAGIGLVSAIASFFGIGTVVVLAARSLSEWRQLSGRPGPPDRSDQGPPTC